MTFMPWSESLAVGMPEIDDQHGWLVDAVNRLHAEMTRQSPNRGTLGEILEGLVDYTMNHFIVEEELFKRHAYPQADAHLAEHNKFTAAIMDALTAFENGQDIGHNVLELLKHWLTEHIMKVDRAYVPFLRV